MDANSESEGEINKNIYSRIRDGTKPWLCLIYHSISIENFLQKKMSSFSISIVIVVLCLGQLTRSLQVEDVRGFQSAGYP